jgi:hypothetical protein
MNASVEGIVRAVRHELLERSMSWQRPVAADALGRAIQRAGLLGVMAGEQEVRAMAYRGWARSLRRRDRRVRAQAAMLREQAQAGVRPALPLPPYGERAGDGTMPCP